MGRTKQEPTKIIGIRIKVKNEKAIRKAIDKFVKPLDK